MASAVLDGQNGPRDHIPRTPIWVLVLRIIQMVRLCGLHENKIKT